jgi:uncharacterized protein (TIGR01319 family)
MPTSIVDAESLLAIDLGAVHTRAMLFDVVEGEYHFIAAASALTTLNAPISDVSEGMQQAVEQLEMITGRTLVDKDYRMIIPSQADGSGFDHLVITFSAGPSLQIVTMGLLADVSLDSANRLAASTYGRLAESIGLNDRRKAGAQVDAIVKAQPDLVIMTGGTDGGATRSVGRMLELFTMACKVMPDNHLPYLVYAGNQALANKIKEILTQQQILVTTAPNARPGVDQEDLTAGRDALAEVVSRLRTKQIAGLSHFTTLTDVRPLPAVHASSRIIHFLSEVLDPVRGAMSVDLGASYTAITAAAHGATASNVVPLGMGEGLKNLLVDTPLDEIIRWLPIHIPAENVRDYLYQKMIVPASVPITLEALAIEQAAARVVLRHAARDLMERFTDLYMGFERILVSGATLTQAPSAAQTILMLLDGLQPLGVCALVLDPYGLVPALGAAAGVNSLLPVQVFESNAFINLATVICPLIENRSGATVLHVRMEDNQQHKVKLDVKQGTIVRLPLHLGQEARVFLEPLHGTVVDPTHQIGNNFKVIGGICGVVIDARGRPFGLPADAGHRREQLRRWAAALEE